MKQLLMDGTMEVSEERWEIPDGWRWESIARASEIIMGQSPPGSTYNEDGDGFPFYQGKTDFGELNPTPRVWCTKPKKMAQAGDILLSVRAPVGPTNIAIEDCAIGRGLCILRARDGMPSRYLREYLRLIEKQIADMGQGSTFTAINKADIETIQIPLPPIPEQHRIVNKIESLFAEARTARAALDRAEPLLKKFRQAVLSAAFRGELSERDSDNWKNTTLGEVIDSLQYGTSVKADADEQIGIPVLRMGNIQDGEIDLTKLKFIDRAKENIPKYLMKKGDILINRTNSPELVGKAAMFNKDGEYLFASYLIRLCANPTIILPEYLNGIINSDIGRQHVVKVKHQVAGQANINSQNIRDMPIPLPPIAEQHRIMKRVESLFAQAEQVERAVEIARRRAEKVEQAILARAFRGEL